MKTLTTNQRVLNVKGTLKLSEAKTAKSLSYYTDSVGNIRVNYGKQEFALITKNEIKTTTFESSIEVDALIEWIRDNKKDVEVIENNSLVIIEDTVNSYDDSLHIDTKLQNIDKNKAKIKKLSKENKALISEVFPLVNDMIKAIRTESEVFAKATKKTVATVLKTRLGSNNPLITLALTLNIEGLNIDNTISISNIKTLVKMFNEGEISKSSINKSSKEQLEEDITKYKDEVKLLKAIELVENAPAIEEENYVELSA